MSGSGPRHRRAFRRGRRGDTRGVVAVVGTLLALLVFFALFGVFLTQYVPLWMSEDEQALTIQDQTSLADLKSGVDEQVATGGPAVVATPIPLASQSIPLLSQPTFASAVFSPPGTSGGPYANYTLSPAPGSSVFKSKFIENYSVGALRVTVPSRYYAPQTFSLENDAVVQAQQSTQQVIDFPPTFTVNVSGSGFGVTAALVVLSGVSTAATGSSTQEIFTHFISTTTFTASTTNASESATFVEGTSYPCAWYNFTTSTLTSSAPAGFAGHYTAPAKPPASACGASSFGIYPVKFVFSNLASFTLIYAEIRLVVGIGTE